MRLHNLIKLTTQNLLNNFDNLLPTDPLKDPHICGRPNCPINDGTKFRYNTTILYTYDYRMHVRTEFSGSGQNTSDVYVLATAQLTFPQPCEGILKLKNVQLKTVEESTNEDSDEPVADYYEYSEPEPDRSLHPRNVEFGEALQTHDLR